MQSHNNNLAQKIQEIETEMHAPKAAPVMAVVATDDGKGFDAFDLPRVLAASLAHMKYTNPTPIQVQAIPAVMKNKDLLASAQTGTGKTGAFIIPILAKLMVDPHSLAVIMAPTRELASQILAVAHQMAHGHQAIKTALLIGGESMGRQRAQLSARPRLIVGTPGRMNDHLRSNPRMFMSTTTLVLDEADRMLDMGFAPQIKEIIQTMSPKRQTLMFSATFPENIMKFAQQYLRDPVRISIEPERTSAACIKHEELHTSEGARYGELVREMNAREGSIIVFIKTKHGADRMVKKLQLEKFSADVLHGGLNQRQRDRAIAGFRSGKTRIMIATDVAARGLDVPHIEHVINYDLPQVPEDYVHRIGRTGRNGKEGTALSFIMPSENGKWRAIQRILNPNAPRTGREEGGANRPSRGRQGNGRDYSRGGKSQGGFRQNREQRPERSERPQSNFRPQMDDMAAEFQPDQPRYEGKPRFDKPRAERPYNNDRPQGERQFGDKPRFEKKSYGDRPQGDRPFGDKPRFEKKSYGDRPQGDRPFGDKPRFEKKSYGDRPQGDRPYGDKPRFEKKFGDKPRFEKKPYGERAQGGEGNFRPREDNMVEGNFKPRENNERDGNRQDAPRSDRPQGGKPFKKPFFKKKSGGGFGGNKKFGSR